MNFKLSAPHPLILDYYTESVLVFHAAQILSSVQLIIKVMEDRLFLKFCHLLKTLTVEVAFDIEFPWLEDRPLTFQVKFASIAIDLFCLA